MMFITKKSLPRRTLLRGLGATLALPFLDAMAPALSALAKTAAVRRLGFVYVPNGVIMENWTPTGEGRAFDLSRILKPIEPFRDQMVVLTGLARHVEGNVHASASAAWLTSEAHWLGPRKVAAASVLDGRVTIDQVAAAHLGQQTQLASLELGLEGGDHVGDCDIGFSCAYTNSISWRTPTTPLPVETNPRVVFERLFGDSDNASAKARLLRLQEDRSILDAVTREVSIVQRDLGAGDRHKLNQYLDAVRDVERRIQRAEEQNAGSEVPDVNRPIGVPDRFVDHARLMFDLQVLAYQIDMTRVITFMIGREISNRPYPEIGVPEPHHSASHHQNDKEKLEKCTLINTLHVQMFAYYLEKLRGTPDGDGNLLDHSIIVYGGALSDPNVHSHENLPVVLAGGGAAGIKGNRHLRYPQNTSMTNLLMTLLDKSQVPLDTVAESAGKIEFLPDL